MLQRFGRLSFRSGPKLMSRFSAHTSKISSRFFSTTNSTDPHNVLPHLARAEKVVGKRVTSPKFVFIAIQSGGKSSVNDAITGLDISHKDVTMATKRSLIQVLNRTSHETFVEFSDGEKIFNIEKVKKRIFDENNAVDGVEDDPIYITIHSPNVQNCTIIDLPELKNAVFESILIKSFFSKTSLMHA